MSVRVITRNLSKSEIVQLPPVLLELERQSMRLRDLIGLTVTEQVHELAARLAVERSAAERAGVEAATEVSRYYLLSGTPDRPVELEVPDIDAAISHACRAFDSNRYVVLIGGTQVDDLDQVVEVPPDTSVTFLRLTPLKGG